MPSAHFHSTPLGRGRFGSGPMVAVDIANRVLVNRLTKTQMLLAVVGNEAMEAHDAIGHLVGLGVWL